MHKIFSLLITGGAILFSSLIITSCDAVEDLQGVAALRNVEFEFDSLKMNINLPEGALSGQSFQELLSQNPDTYGNPANYGIAISSYYLADNTASDASDAKFDGMYQDIVVNSITTSPLRLDTPSFEVSEDQTRTVQSTGSINLQTHKQAGLYIFRQTVDGEDVSAAIATGLLYDIAGQDGVINLPEIQRDIPTRASDDMKAFLSGLLESGILETE